MPSKSVQFTYLLNRHLPSIYSPSIESRAGQVIPLDQLPMPKLVARDDPWEAPDREGISARNTRAPPGFRIEALEQMHVRAT